MPDLGIISEILSYDVCQLPDSDAAWYANRFMHKQGIRSRARYQAQLDRWVGEQRAIAAEERRLKRDLDPYNLGLYDDDFHVLKKGKG